MAYYSSRNTTHDVLTINNDAQILDDLFVTDDVDINGSLDVAGEVITSVATGVTAYAGGGQANATAISSHTTVVGTSATHLDSVKLPAATVGAVYEVINNGAKDVAVYTQTGGQINSLGTNAAYALASGSVQRFRCAASNQWYTLNRSERPVDTGDAAANDYAQSDLTMDSTYRSLSLTSKIPPSAYGRQVKLKVRLQHTAAREINFRKAGNSNTTNIQVVRSQVANDNNGEEVTVFTSSAGAIEYSVAAATGTIAIHVLGYYVEG